MIIQCENCSRKFLVKNDDIPKKGRMVQCGYCSQKWFQTPIKIKTPVQRKRVKKKIEAIEIQDITKIIDPSSEETISEKIRRERHLPDVYKSKQGLGFLGYIFLFIIIAFSIVGIIKTFESDLLNYFPESEYVFQLFNQQLKYFSETVRNLITITKDLINSY